MNSKIEEVRDPWKPNLLNMPIIVMGKVLKNLDFPSIFRLRKVCRTLRFSIEQIKPDLLLDSVILELPLTTSSLESYFRNMREDDKRFYRELYGPRTGCLLTWNQRNIYKSKQITMEDAETLLKNPKLILRSLSIDLGFENFNSTEYIEKKEEDLKKFYESMKSLLGNREQLLKTEEIRLNVHQVSQAADFLKCTDPESLKTISIYSYPREEDEMDFSELEELEQWKNSEELEVYGNYILTPVESFASFTTIIVCVDRIPIGKLNEVKELFVRSPNSETLTIKCDGLRDIKDQIQSNFGQFELNDEEFGDHYHWLWLKDVPGSTEKLQITMCIGSSNGITFSKI